MAKKKHKRKRPNPARYERLSIITPLRSGLFSAHFSFKKMPKTVRFRETAKTLPFEAINDIWERFGVGKVYRGHNIEGKLICVCDFPQNTMRAYDQSFRQIIAPDIKKQGEFMSQKQWDDSESLMTFIGSEFNYAIAQLLARRADYQRWLNVTAPFLTPNQASRAIDNAADLDSRNPRLDLTCLPDTIHVIEGGG